jgi:hypothetical protein
MTVLLLRLLLRLLLGFCLPRFQLDVSYDYRADPMLYEACSDDAAKHCKDVKPGGGRIQACLVRHAACVLGLCGRLHVTSRRVGAL